MIPLDKEGPAEEATLKSFHHWSLNSVYVSYPLKVPTHHVQHGGPFPSWITEQVNCAVEHTLLHLALVLLYLVVFMSVSSLGFSASWRQGLCLIYFLSNCWTVNIVDAQIQIGQFFKKHYLWDDSYFWILNRFQRSLLSTKVIPYTGRSNFRITDHSENLPKQHVPIALLREVKIQKQ